MKTINDFDLNSKYDRYKARKAGFDVPKQKTGIKRQDFWFLVNVKDKNECWPWLGTLNMVDTEVMVFLEWRIVLLMKKQLAKTLKV